MKDSLTVKAEEFNLDHTMRYNATKILKEFKVTRGNADVKTATHFNNILSKKGYLTEDEEGVKRLAIFPSTVEVEHILKSKFGYFSAYTPEGVIFVLGLLSGLSYVVTHKETGKDIGITLVTRDKKA